MKNATNRTIICLVFLGIVGACTGKQETMESDDWAELDSYHMIMAESYHPLKDSSNLAPAKANAEALAAEAAKWASAELPDKVNTDEMKSMIATLNTSTRAFADMVGAGATDEELTAALTALHGEFHHIMEAWEGRHEHH